MDVQITQLEKAHAALQRSLAVLDRLDENADADLTETVRAGVIQNFEVAYEQSWKVLRRWRMHNFSIEDSDLSQRRQLYRLAGKHLLIEDVDAWWDFHAARNMTSRTYNPVIAQEVATIARQFEAACSASIKTLQTLKEND